MATDTAWKPVNNNFHLSTGLVAHQAKQVKVRMHTSSDCKLAMGYLPWMGYNASGGGGVGRGSFTPEGGRRSLDIGFQPDEILIPSISSSTTTIKGFSVIPPFMEIKITPKLLEGWIDLNTREVQLQYNAEFKLIAPGYNAPPLLVNTVLTTEQARTEKNSRVQVLQGSRLDENGYCTLVGVSCVPKTHHKLTDMLLWLPNKALAVMIAKFEIADDSY